MKTLVRNGKTILLDDEDLERVLVVEQEWGRSWSTDDRNHVAMGLRGCTVVLARFLKGYDGPLQVDHIDRNSLNNQKNNLRIVTQSVNKHNSGLYKNNVGGCRGVNFHVRVGKWQAKLYLNKQQIHLGFFRRFEDAVAARKAAEQKYQNEICLPSKA